VLFGALFQTLYLPSAVSVTVIPFLFSYRLTILFFFTILLPMVFLSITVLGVCNSVVFPCLMDFYPTAYVFITVEWSTSTFRVLVTQAALHPYALFRYAIYPDDDLTRDSVCIVPSSFPRIRFNPKRQPILFSPAVCGKQTS